MIDRPVVTYGRCSFSPTLLQYIWTESKRPSSSWNHVGAPPGNFARRDFGAESLFSQKLSGFIDYGDVIF